MGKNEKEIIDYGKLLSKRKMSNTSFRRKLIEIFYNAKYSLSVDDILNFQNISINTASVYRALDSFEKNGLIHKVPDKKNVVKYALCRSDCSFEKHTHYHPHLLCSNCNQTFCLYDFKIPNVNNYKGYEIKNLNMIFEGSCINCNQKIK